MILHHYIEFFARFLILHNSDELRVGELGVVLIRGSLMERELLAFSRRQLDGKFRRRERRAMVPRLFSHYSGVGAIIMKTHCRVEIQRPKVEMEPWKVNKKDKK